MSQQIELRDWFAGQEMNTLAKTLIKKWEFNEDVAQRGDVKREWEWITTSDDDGSLCEDVAEMAYQLADAMLAARQPLSELRVGQQVRVKHGGAVYEIAGITKTLSGQTVYEFDGHILKPEEIEAVEA